ncbi:unnamed protein product, partial [Polarella glacialis]
MACPLGPLHGRPAAFAGAAAPFGAASSVVREKGLGRRAMAAVVAAPWSPVAAGSAASTSRAVERRPSSSSQAQSSTTAAASALCSVTLALMAATVAQGSRRRLRRLARAPLVQRSVRLNRADRGDLSQTIRSDEELDALAEKLKLPPAPSRLPSTKGARYWGLPGTPSAEDMEALVEDMVPGRSAGNPGAFNPHTDDPLTKGIDLMLGRKNQLQRLICCRGCGIPLQTHDPSNVGYVRFAKYLDTWAEKTHRKIMCSRCLQLERGELVPIVKETLGPRAYSAESSEQLGFGGHVVDAEVLLRQLRIIRQRRCLVVYVMDVLDFNGAYIRNIREIAGRNPMIAIATKIDLLPPKTDLESVHNWLRYALLKKRLRVVGVNMVSNETGKGIKHAMNAIIEARHGMDVFVVGSANAGKSMFISKFLHAMEEKYPEGGLEDVERPVVSKTPGTTLGTIPLRAFRRSVTSRIFASLFDTPGVHQPTSLQNLIEIQAYNMVQPTRAFGVTTLRPAKDILAALKKSGQLASAQNVEAWLARPVRYLWGFPGQPPVACIEVVPPITTALQLSFVGCHNLSIICEANVGPSADPERGGLPEPPDGLVMNQICNIKTLEELTMEGEVLADVSLAGFGWVAVSMSAISQAAAGKQTERSKLTLRVYGPRRLKVKIAAFPMPIGGLPGKVPKPPE